MSTAKRQHRCPNCRDSSRLWEGIMVSGWRSIDEYLEPSSGAGLDDRDVDWDVIQPDGVIGCGECGWEGVTGDLEELGIDGQPLIPVHPAQLSISEAAP